MRFAPLAAVAAFAAVAAADDLPNGQKGFQGTWTIVSLEHGGRQPDKVTNGTVVFKGSEYEIKHGDKTVETGTFKAVAAKTPHLIDAEAKTGEHKGTKWHGLYELEGDTLRAVVVPADKARPRAVTVVPEGGRGFTLKRAAKQ